MHRKLVFIVFACMAATACSDAELGDLREYVDEVKARTPGKVAPLPELVVYKGHQYASAELRDPFKQSFTGEKVAPVQAAKQGGGPDLERPRGQLEQFPLDNLRLMGSMRQGDQQWGLVQSAQGELYRVKTGDYMGQNHGKVLKINEKEIMLRELISDGLGGWEERITTLALSE